MWFGMRRLSQGLTLLGSHAGVQGALCAEVIRLRVVFTQNDDTLSRDSLMYFTHSCELVAAGHLSLAWPVLFSGRPNVYYDKWRVNLAGRWNVLVRLLLLYLPVYVSYTLTSHTPPLYTFPACVRTTKRLLRQMASEPGGPLERAGAIGDASSSAQVLRATDRVQHFCNGSAVQFDSDSWCLEDQAGNRPILAEIASTMLAFPQVTFIVYRYTHIYIYM